MRKQKSLMVLLVLFALPVLAHHSGVTYFDIGSPVEHTDVTVVSYDLVNPHGRLVFIVTAEDGTEVEWSAEMPSANNARRRGLGGDFFKPGDRLQSASGPPARSGAPSMRLDRAVLANGDIVQVTGPNRGFIPAEQ